VCTKIEFRANGYGKKIIEHLINEAIEKKCYKINLVCNINTSYFYKHCDFEEKGVHMSYLIN
jgi:citrate lyase synthetase